VVCVFVWGALVCMGGAACDVAQALWSQTQDDVFVYALAPSYTKGRDVSVRLKEKWLRIAVHEPEPRAPSSLAASTPARDRRVRSVILCGKLAFRVRAGDGEELDWEVTDVFDATLAPRRAVRLHLRKRAPGANFVPSHKPAWDAEYTGPGAWRESLVKVWWDRLMKHDAPIPTSAMPDRQHGPAAQMEATWREANEQFKRDVLDMKPVDLSPLLVEGAKERERARVEADLVAHGVPRGSAEWDEAMAQVCPAMAPLPRCPPPQPPPPAPPPPPAAPPRFPPRAPRVSSLATNHPIAPPSLH